jgi:hypothetical protein
MEKMSRDNEPNVSKDDEFKIHLSTEDINKIDEKIRDMNNSSKPIEKSNESKNKVEMIKIEKNQNTVKGLSLLNVCANCKKEFIPKYSMINEKLCKSCLEK